MGGGRKKSPLNSQRVFSEEARFDWKKIELTYTFISFPFFGSEFSFWQPKGWWFEAGADIFVGGGRVNFQKVFGNFSGPFFKSSKLIRVYYIKARQTLPNARKINKNYSQYAKKKP